MEHKSHKMHTNRFTPQNYVKICTYAIFFVLLHPISMTRKTLYHIIEWSVAIAACGYLVWKLATYQDYPALWASLQAMTWPQWLALILCVALMPLNMTLEAWRWRFLVPMSWREAHRQVYYSKLAGLITPWRLGEYPARALMMEQSLTNQQSSIGNQQSSIINLQSSIINHKCSSAASPWPTALSMGAVGSVTMTAAIVIAGVIALAFSPAVMTYLGNRYLYSLGAAILLLAILFLLFPRLLKRYATITPHILFCSTGQSLIRLACWCLQLAFILYALSALPLTSNLSPLGEPEGSFQLSTFLFPLSTFNFQLSTLLPLYFLLITITPNVPIAEIGVRGAWAIVLFGSVNAALAGVLLWAINTLLPCLTWFFLRRKRS